ncbi:MAG: 4a-hydroxytetrahydrobiopterin dehydratase [Burkholderiaceae bacterium]
MRPPLSRPQLLEKKSSPMEGQRAYTQAEIDAQLASLPSWTCEGNCLQRSFAFRDYYDTIAFVNALAWMIHGEDHHPDLEVGYNRCVVRWSTHSVSGLSDNDFICAAKTDAVFAHRPL